MPNLSLLLNFITNIEHESLLEASTNIESHRLHMNLPFPDINKSIFHYHHLISENNNVKKGVSPGDAINLVGETECAWVLNEIANFTLDHTLAHIIYIDNNENQDKLTAKNHQHFHYFKSQDIIHCLDTYLSLHSDWHVLYIMWDGVDNQDSKYLRILRQLQKKWSFILWTTSAQSEQDSFHFIDYKFQLAQGKPLQMQLIWPMHMNAFII